MVDSIVLTISALAIFVVRSISGHLDNIDILRVVFGLSFIEDIKVPNNLQKFEIGSDVYLVYLFYDRDIEMM